MDLNLRFPATPQHASSHAELIVPLALELSRATLDFTPASLSDVDRIVEELRAGGVRLETVAETLFCFGCYVGEVSVRHEGASWRVAAETPMAGLSGAPLVLQLGPEDYCNPIGKVFKRFGEWNRGQSFVFLHCVLEAVSERASWRRRTGMKLTSAGTLSRAALFRLERS